MTDRHRQHPILVQHRPLLDVHGATQVALALYNLKATAVELPGERDRNFHLRTDDGREYVLKIANATESEQILDLQNQVLDHLADRNPALPLPRLCPTQSGKRLEQVQDDDGRSCFVRLLTWLPGRPAGEIGPLSPPLLYETGYFLGRLDAALQGFSHPAMERDLQWDLQRAAAVTANYADLLADEGRRRLVADARRVFAVKVAPQLPSLRRSVIHGDANDYNLLVKADRVTGLIDFGDMVYSCTVFELAIALAYLMLDQPEPIAAAAHVVSGYHAAFALTPTEAALLLPLARMRLATTVTLAAFQRQAQPDNAYLSISERPAWQLIERLQKVPEALATETFLLACGLGPAMHRAAREPRPPAIILAQRERHLGPSLSLSYRKPLKIVRGAGAYLYDEEGRAYLDCVNNVCGVGHSHPRVVQAAAAQMAALNTNTRYLHDNLVAYAERLTATLPDPLRVCFFVCSGSEANELALRMARTHTGRRDIIVVDGAYHGNTQALIEISPYKHDGPGGSGPPHYVHTVPMPDPYRGLYRGGDAANGDRYAAHVETAIERAGESGIAAFICESLLGCGGQIVLPDGYLEAAFRHTRAAGGVCIVDEVQVGFGRVGTHFWGFELQGVVPDIVTMGKPMGNGHPLAAVVTTPEIAAAFANGMEYFNTFGGNPVSCAVGMAVLDVIEDEGLRENARLVGSYLLNRLQTLAERYPVIGDVRGRGLFIGIELVHDRETLAPAADVAGAVVEQMKEAGILLSTDGPLHNVIKIKPPLVFSKGDADLLSNNLERVLGKLFP